MGLTNIEKLIFMLLKIKSAGKWRSFSLEWKQNWIIFNFQNRIPDIVRCFFEVRETEMALLSREPAPVVLPLKVRDVRTKVVSAEAAVGKVQIRISEKKKAEKNILKRQTVKSNFLISSFIRKF